MRKIALVNQKGGVGKTTTAVNLSAAVARHDRKVLLLDLDPQANATVHFGLRPPELKATTYSLLSGGATPRDAMREVARNLWIIPSSLDLAGAEMELSTQIGREYVLREALRDLADFDFIFVDCPPSLGVLNVNGLVFVDEIFIPVQCEFFALHGLSLLLRTVELVKRRLNPGLTVSAFVPCMYDARKGLARETVGELERHFQGRVFGTRIRANVRLAEAPSHGMTIFDYAPDSNGAEDYDALAREILGLPKAEPQPPAPEQATPNPAPLIQPTQA
ncbi:MAG: ParA family protein [Planctomycetes bacterium]|nr:ParA family protein [Planctomycetota bacterium]